MAPLDDIFKVLEIANELEEERDQRIEAATKVSSRMNAVIPSYARSNRDCYNPARRSTHPQNSQPFQYYEAVYLMKRYVQRLPETEVDGSTGTLMSDKITHYQQHAARLMRDTPSSRKLNPRSPVQGDTDSVFFEEVPLVPCVPVSPQVGNESETAAVDSLAARANSKLAAALDLDEAKDKIGAIDAYMEAAEIYLEALQECEINVGQSTKFRTMAISLKKRLEQTLDRVEQLKRPPKIEPVLTRVLPSKKKKESSTKGSLTAEEIEILKQSSLIASNVFLPWSDAEANQLSSSKQTTRFTDPDGMLALSTQQKARFYRWARPSEICELRKQCRLTQNLQTPVAVQTLSPYNIRQQCVTDCSFIASLCICASFERRFRKQLITSILYPQNSQGLPVYSPSGKYMVKLWFNGVARRVVIDDYFPIDKQGNLLCSITTDTCHPSQLELWVCLIEKAYMKLCGGYNFPGSNSGYDLFSLTGWIPERILFAKDRDDVKDFETHPDRVWQRIFSACSYGDCLITVSTQNELTKEEADRIGLVTGHAYAVLNVVETRNGTKLLQLKNPWARKGWVGKYSSSDSVSWTEALSEEVGYNPMVAAKRDDGIFWICWDDILKYFQNFHLSWTPFLFKFRTQIHGFWHKEQGPNDDTFNVSDNPQYILQLSDEAIAKKATVWILISRHVAKQEQEGQEVCINPAISAHETDSHSVLAGN